MDHQEVSQCSRARAILTLDTRAESPGSLTLCCFFRKKKKILGLDFRFFAPQFCLFLSKAEKTQLLPKKQRKPRSPWEVSLPHDQSLTWHLPCRGVSTEPSLAGPISKEEPIVQKSPLRKGGRPRNQEERTMHGSAEPSGRVYTETSCRFEPDPGVLKLMCTWGLPGAGSNPASAAWMLAVLCTLRDEKSQQCTRLQKWKSNACPEQLLFRLFVCCFCAEG